MARVHLSFDDGPGPSTPHLLDVLRKAECAATFFVLGRNLERDMDTAVRAIVEGHVLGNHTYSHARPGCLSAEALVDEIDVTDALIREAYRLAGRSLPAEIPLRLPYGAQAGDPRVDVLDGLKRPHVGWTAIVDDWRPTPPSPSALCEGMRMHIAEHATCGGQVSLCLHDGSRHRDRRDATVEAVRLLLDVQFVPATEETDPRSERP